MTTPDIVSPTRSTALADLALAGVDRERVAHTGAQRVLQQRQRELFGEQHDADFGEAARDALHRREPVGRREARPEHDHRRARRARCRASTVVD